MKESFNMKNKIVLSLILILSMLMPINAYAVSFNAKETIFGPAVSEYAKAHRATYSQFEAHPKNCIFGEKEDYGAIKSVDVKKRKKKYMSLTFDSSWVNTETYALLDMLDKYDAKATFFLTSIFIKDNPEQVKAISARGHEIGNHTTTHTSFLKFKSEDKKEKMKEEIMGCHKLIKDLLGVDMCLFRFPYGDYDADAIQVVKELGYYPIQWTADSSDWKNISVNAILDLFKSKVYYRPGNIILFHNGAIYTVSALDTILKDITDMGLRCVRVSDLIYTENFHLGKNLRQIENVPEEKAGKEKVATKSNAKKK